MLLQMFPQEHPSQCFPIFFLVSYFWCAGNIVAGAISHPPHFSALLRRGPKVFVEHQKEETKNKSQNIETGAFVMFFAMVRTEWMQFYHLQRELFLNCCKEVILMSWCASDWGNRCGSFLHLDNYSWYMTVKPIAWIDMELLVLPISFHRVSVVFCVQFLFSWSWKYSIVIWQ